LALAPGPWRAVGDFHLWGSWVAPTAIPGSQPEWRHATQVGGWANSRKRHYSNVTPPNYPPSHRCPATGTRAAPTHDFNAYRARRGVAVLVGWG
jgi:hypothetical protein